MSLKAAFLLHLPISWPILGQFLIISFFQVCSCTKLIFLFQPIRTDQS